MARPPHDAFGQQVGQGAVDGRVRLAENGRQLRRINERCPAEGVEQLSFGEGHGSGLPKAELWTAVVKMTWEKRCSLATISPFSSPRVKSTRCSGPGIHSRSG